jgi:hypothetical protein
MPIPETARRSLARQLKLRREARWPDLVELPIRYRGSFAYVDAVTADGDTMPLLRLRYLGSPHTWGFAIYLASKDGYEDSILPTGTFTGTPEEALDCACGLYLGDISAWTETRQDRGRDSPNNF